MPDHSTFSKNRHGRFRESDLFRQLFEEVVRLCLQAGLVGGEGFAIDANVIEADASLRRRAEGKPTAWPEAAEVSRPVRKYLDALIRPQRLKQSTRRTLTMICLPAMPPQSRK